jgi:hypothetical protein
MVVALTGTLASKSNAVTTTRFYVGIPPGGYYQECAYGAVPSIAKFGGSAVSNSSTSAFISNGGYCNQSYGPAFADFLESRSAIYIKSGGVFGACDVSGWFTSAAYNSTVLSSKSGNCGNGQYKGLSIHRYRVSGSFVSSPEFSSGGTISLP